MDCPHCGRAFHDYWKETTIKECSNKYRFQWEASVAICPACNEPTIELSHFELKDGLHLKVRFRVFPQASFRKPTPKDVPQSLKEDYEEACRVLPFSNKASAALARRCVQAILHEKGYLQHDLAKQIDALIAETNPLKSIPTGLRTTIDAIRNFGNFAAHPITDKTTLQIINVDPGEAEWCLDILEEMFDHYYTKPAEAAARKAALDAKLRGAGKPTSK